MIGLFVMESAVFRGSKLTIVAPRHLKTYSDPVGISDLRILRLDLAGCMEKTCIRDVIKIVPLFDTGQKRFSTSDDLTLSYMSIHLRSRGFELSKSKLIIKQMQGCHQS